MPLASALMWCVSWAAVCSDSAIRVAMIRRMLLIFSSLWSEPWEVVAVTGEAADAGVATVLDGTRPFWLCAGEACNGILVAWAMACCTSLSMILPFGPEPWMALMFSPAAAATLRARGDMRILPPFDCAVLPAVCAVSVCPARVPVSAVSVWVAVEEPVSGGVDCPVSAAIAPGRNGEMSSPCWPMTATLDNTGTSSPSS